ncbi:cyclin-domain-containing protein [Elsinoe ampelina]|uniref:Cyclin-domain-containing protein n=1 Tax=Elsinoe ampelina TaxID=302913 RepID=A0A6A6GHK8_9PEZI|nr:cyclin-domain-containing protein [Elsinoe ampelina]
MSPEKDAGSTPPPEPNPRVSPSNAEKTAIDSAAAVVKDPVEESKGATIAQLAPKKAKVDSKGIKIMPRQYETCDPKDLGVLIADMLMELIRLNDKIPLKDGKLTRFHSRAPPGISCHDYLNRLIQHATLSPPILLSMVYYIDRLCALYPAFTIGSLTVHRFLITAATVASKGLSDSFWTNPTYARIGGISTSELATLELDFLQRVHFRIVPKPETLVDYYMSLVQRSDDYRLEDEALSSSASLESEPISDPMEEDPS